MKRKTTTVEKVRTVTRIMTAGESVLCEPKGGKVRTWAANQIRQERARQRSAYGKTIGLDSVGFAGLRRG